VQFNDIHFCTIPTLILMTEQMTTRLLPLEIAASFTTGISLNDSRFSARHFLISKNMFRVVKTNTNEDEHDAFLYNAALFRNAITINLSFFKASS
jgi:hypothetical protein